MKAVETKRSDITKDLIKLRSGKFSGANRTEGFATGSSRGFLSTSADKIAWGTRHSSAFDVKKREWNSRVHKWSKFHLRLLRCHWRKNFHKIQRSYFRFAIFQTHEHGIVTTTPAIFVAALRPPQQSVLNELHATDTFCPISAYTWANTDRSRKPGHPLQYFCLSYKPSCTRSVKHTTTAWQPVGSVAVLISAKNLVLCP